jgi:hypothetical protein
LALSLLIFLGRFIPHLKVAESWFLGVKVIIKIGDRYKELTYKPCDPQTQAMMQAIKSGAPVPVNLQSFLTARTQTGAVPSES